ncbi:SH3 domain-containing protein [Kitasatospora sp. NPDC004240]
MRIRRVLAVTAVGAALALGATAAPAVATATTSGQVAGVTCGNLAWPHQQQTSTYGKVIKSTSAAVHTGPYGSCATVAYLSPGAEVQYDCFVLNDYNNTWTWVRNRGGASIGWVYNGYLSGGGSSKMCALTSASGQPMSRG